MRCSAFPFFRPFGLGSEGKTFALQVHPCDAGAKDAPDANGGPTLEEALPRHNLSDEYFIIDPEHREVVMATGSSRHAFNFGSVVSEIMAQFALDGATRLDTALFSLRRLASA